MYVLRVKTHFDAAHFLKAHPGKCSQMHGHRWYVEVAVEGSTLTRPGNMLVDFALIKEELEKLVGMFDHSVINDVLGVGNPTAELLALWFFGRLQEQLVKVADEPLPAKLVSVTVWESPDCSVEYRDEVGIATSN